MSEEEEKKAERTFVNQLLFSKAGDRQDILEMRGLCFKLILSEVRRYRAAQWAGVSEVGRKEQVRLTCQFLFSPSKPLQSPA